MDPDPRKIIADPKHCYLSNISVRPQAIDSCLRKLNGADVLNLVKERVFFVGKCTNCRIFTFLAEFQLN